MRNKRRTEGREGAWYDMVCWPYYNIIILDQYTSSQLILLVSLPCMYIKTKTSESFVLHSAAPSLPPFACAQRLFDIHMNNL